jgi:hypothetical protein
MRWAVEAQSDADGVVTVHVEDVKHSVTIYGCYKVPQRAGVRCRSV